MLWLVITIGAVVGVDLVGKDQGIKSGRLELGRGKSIGESEAVISFIWSGDQGINRQLQPNSYSHLLSLFSHLPVVPHTSHHG